MEKTTIYFLDLYTKTLLRLYYTFSKAIVTFKLKNHNPHCVPTGSKWMKMVLKNLIWIFMLSLIVLKHWKRNFWDLTTSFSRPYRLMPAKQAQFGNLADLAGRTLYGWGKPVVRFQKFLLLCFTTIKLSIKIHMRFLSTIFIHFDPEGTRCNVLAHPFTQ